MGVGALNIYCLYIHDPSQSLHPWEAGKKPRLIAAGDSDAEDDADDSN